MKRAGLEQSCRCNARARSKAVPLKVKGITVVLLLLILIETIVATNANAAVAASLRFKSSYDAPVFLSGTPVTGIHGADQGYSWDDVKTWWSLEGMAASVNCAFIDSIPSADPLGPQTTPTGSASSKTFYINFPSIQAGVCREELIMFFADEAPSGTEMGYMKNFYMSQWYFLPINFSMNLLQDGQTGYWGWLNPFSVREYPPDGNLVYGFAPCGLMLMRDQTKYYLRLFQRRYMGSGGTYWNDAYITSQPFPFGQWVHLEIYLERSTTDPIIKVWQNDNLIFDLNKNNMHTLHDNNDDGVYDYYDPLCSTPRTTVYGVTPIGYFIKVSALYTDYDTMNGHMPLKVWFDDLEIWDGLPREEPPVIPIIPTTWFAGAAAIAILVIFFRSRLFGQRLGGKRKKQSAKDHLAL